MTRGSNYQREGISSEMHVRTTWGQVVFFGFHGNLVVAPTHIIVRHDGFGDSIVNALGLWMNRLEV